MIIDNHKQTNNYLDTSNIPGTTSVINRVKTLINFKINTGIHSEYIQYYIYI